MGLFDKKSKSKSTTTTSVQDNRLIVGEGAIGIGTGANVTNADSTQIVRMNSELLGTLAGQQTDAVRAVAALGLSGFDRLGGSVTDLYEQAGKNTTQALGFVVDAQRESVAQLIAASGENSDAAKAIAQSAITSYRPDGANASDSIKWLALAAAAVVVVVMLRK